MQLNKIEKFYILPLICSAAVLRKGKHFRELLLLAKTKRIPSKKIYEALLQNYLFAGYPSALEALKIFNEFFPGRKLNKSDDFNLYHFRKNGEQNCRKIYGDKFEKLISNINLFSPEMSNWLVLEGYGKVLGRKNLSLLEREYCIVSVLSALRFQEQLYSHINGAFRQGAKEFKIKKIITNLIFLEERRSVTIGLKVLDKYLEKRGRK
jgi:4-carboxymuconolactone decarboxylase